MKKNAPIVLIGMKHTGKSTIGKILATQLHYSFFDTDTVISEIAGKTARELFDFGGSQLMQQFETQAFEQIYNTKHTTQIVIATGGGLADNKEAIRFSAGKGLHIYLNTPFELLFSRIMLSAERDGRLPLFLQGGDPQEIFFDLFSRRSAIYATMSDTIINTGAQTPPEIAGIIMEYILHD